LERFDYVLSRQTGSHMRLTTLQNGEHHVTIPDHDDLRVGTLSSVLTQVANHLGLDKESLIERLF
jgi:predicted RNA binding protein YcfA (HicA-like mRNA interferase family)